MSKLSGTKVVEIAGIGPGPFCAMTLADLGADVIVVERAGTLPEGSLNADVALTNRGKRSVSVDLKSAEGRDTVLRLIEGADALIEGMRPGVMERLGLGPDVCLARNPRLVYGRLTGWGQTGPLAQAAGHDANYISLSGALHYASPAGQPPVAPFSLVGDVAGGSLYLVIGLLSGLLEARATGKGCVVDAAITDGSAHMLALVLNGKKAGRISDARGESLHDASHFYDTYRCADGGFVTVAPVEPQFYRLMLQMLGLADEPLFATQWDRTQWPAQRERLQEVFASRSRAAWQALFEGSDACVAPVLSPEEAARHPHNVARGNYFERDGYLQAMPAPRFDGEPATPGAIPRRGQHTQAVLAALEGGAGSPWLRG
ncbi:CoA-transferase [Burkholderiaceae bacterium 16]|nr:CoA-transferase [Burkholderiaceae bacterium 16]